MLALALAAALSVHGGPQVDSLAIYAALLQEVRTHYPGVPVVLAQTRSGVACMPLCGARLRDPDAPAPADTTPGPAPVAHSDGLLRQLRERALIDATCRVPADTFGCEGTFPGYIFAGLGEIQESPPRGPPRVEGGVWVKLALLVPCTTNCRTPGPDEPYFPDAFGYWSLSSAATTVPGRW